ncbi:MAG TPA: beta-carotene 15,15'-monooxygenase, partial [Mucilaginibacter sp.]
MIKLFRSFNPVNIVWLAVFLFLMRLSFAYFLPAKVGFPFVELFSRLLIPVSYQYPIPPIVNLFSASVLVFIQAILINYLVNQYNLLGKSTFLPALMYITLSGLFIPFLMLSPPLICNFLVIWMMFKMFELYNGDDTKSISYDLGMIVAIGAMIYLPFIYMFLAI